MLWCAFLTSAASSHSSSPVQITFLSLILEYAPKTRRGYHFLCRIHWNIHNFHTRYLQICCFFVILSSIDCGSFIGQNSLYYQCSTGCAPNTGVSEKIINHVIITLYCYSNSLNSVGQVKQNGVWDKQVNLPNSYLSLFTIQCLEMSDASIFVILYSVGHFHLH